MVGDNADPGDRDRLNRLLGGSVTAPRYSLMSRPDPASPPWRPVVEADEVGGPADYVPLDPLDLDEPHTPEDDEDEEEEVELLPRPGFEVLRELPSIVRREAMDVDTLTLYALAERPSVRGDCLTADVKLALAARDGVEPTAGDFVDGCNAQRPCPWLGCRHHAALDVSKGDGLNLAVAIEDLDKLPETCTLDVADRRVSQRLVTIGRVLNLSRERARQIEQRALRKLRAYRWEGDW